MGPISCYQCEKADLVKMQREKERLERKQREGDLCNFTSKYCKIECNGLLRCHVYSLLFLAPLSLSNKHRKKQ